MTSGKPPPTCIDASPIPEANDSRMSAIPYEANLTPMGEFPRCRCAREVRCPFGLRGRGLARHLGLCAIPCRSVRALGGIGALAFNRAAHEARIVGRGLAHARVPPSGAPELRMP